MHTRSSLYLSRCSREEAVEVLDGYTYVKDNMTPQSAKAKGRKLQQYVRDQILKLYPSLHPDDVRSTSMGAGGEDVQLSYNARLSFPYTVECKNRERIAIYKDFEQTTEHNPAWEPLLVLKSNGKQPLAVVNFDHFLELLRRLNHE